RRNLRAGRAHRLDEALRENASIGPYAVAQEQQADARHGVGVGRDARGQLTVLDAVWTRIRTLAERRGAPRDIIRIGDLTVVETEAMPHARAQQIPQIL